MPNYELVARDGGSTIHATITDSVTKEPIDLTGKTVQVRYSLNGGATVERSMTVLNQATNKGEAEYRFLTNDLMVGGTLAGEVRLQAGLSDQLTTVDTFFLSVKEPLA